MISLIQIPLLSLLILSLNCFSSVPSGAMATLHQLRMVSLDHNNIQKVDFTAFRHLNNISVIDLTENKISSIQSSDFEPLQNSSLDSIILAYNMLRSLPFGTFSFLHRVSTIDLQHNAFLEFNVSSFLDSVNISKLSVSYCKIGSIVPLKASSLRKKTTLSIDSVEMGWNEICSIPDYAFRGFSQTRTLNIINNQITTMTNGSFCGLDSLENLDISKNRINSLPSSLFRCNPRLQVLNIARNEILVVNPVAFWGLSVLLKLDLSHNFIGRMDTHHWNNTALRVLDISHNQYTYLNKDLFRWGLANLKVLRISYNDIDTFKANTFDSVSSLQELYLTDMLTSVKLLNGVFSRMKNLIKLDLSFTKIAPQDSIHQFTGTASLEELTMRRNNLKGQDLFDNSNQSSLFDGLISLRKLSLRENNLTGLEPGVFSPLTKLLSLDLSGANITILKPGLFKDMTSLRTLYLNNNCIMTTSANLFSGLDNLGSLFFRNNKLRILDKHLFGATPNLRNLYLSSNKLSQVQRDTFFPTNKSLLIDVSNNPFSCTCELSWFRTWLDESNTRFVNPDKTLCSKTSLKAVIDMPILSFDPAHFCGINIILITSLFFFACIVIYVCVLVYHKCWWLKHKFLLLKLAIAGSGKIMEDFKEDNYDFHLNLMFHDAEEGWVDRVLRPVLEKRFPHLQNIIYGDRDLRVEMFYINAIYDAIENSFKTVLLMSNRSMYDIWCMTKLRLALEHINDTGLDKVILIFVEDIEDDDLPYLVTLFLSKNNPHMWWTDDEDEQELFWAQFQRSMRSNRAIINAIPL
eukprot:XP_011678028.1 PREDICTED: insulin-like growth factor-binding protein complex acid labile subunit [Strongylocentrotus purpuratus]